MYYLIYKITNNINGKIYIGAHKTSDKNDGYMGSGKHITRAIKKYGNSNFIKEILFEFDNEEDMYSKEAELVNEKFLEESNTYNIKLGGFGGFANLEINRKRKSDPEFDKKYRENQSVARKLVQNEIRIRRELDSEFNNQYIEKAKNTSKKGRKTLSIRRTKDSEFDKTYREKNSQSGKLGNRSLLERRQSDPEFDKEYRKSLSDAAYKRNADLKLRRETDPEFNAVYKKNMADAVRRGKEAAKLKRLESTKSDSEKA